MVLGAVNEQEKLFFEEEGYLIIKGIFSQNQVQEIKNEYETYWLELVQKGEIVQKTSRPLESLFPRFRDIHQKKERVKELILSSRLFEAVEYLIGEEALIIATTSYFKVPGARGYPYHQDNVVFGATSETTYSAWISLDYIDLSNGGLKIVRKSNKRGLLPPEKSTDDFSKSLSDESREIHVDEGEEVLCTTTEPGDVVFFDANLVHGSSKNETADKFGRVLTVHMGGMSIEKIFYNHNRLLDKKGNIVRKRINTKPYSSGKDGRSIFEIREAKYFGNNRWK